MIVSTNRWFLWLAIGIVGSSVASEALPPISQANLEPLPVPETVALCYWRSPIALKANGDPKASKALRCVIKSGLDVARELSDSDRSLQTQPMRGAISILGYVGGEEDADFIAGLIGAEFQSEQPDYSIVSEGMNALGTLAKRGSKKAHDALAAWVMWKPWINQKGVSKLRSGNPTQQARFLMMCKALLNAVSRDPNIVSKNAPASLDGFLSAAERKEWAGFKEKLTQDALKESAASLSKAESAKLSERDRALAASAVSRIPTDVLLESEIDEELAAADARRERAQELLSAPERPKELTDDERGRFSREAKEALSVVIVALTKRNYDAVMATLLHDSVFFTEDELKRDRQKILAELPNTAKILAELKLSDDSIKNLTVDTDKKDVIVVRWHIAGSERVGKRLQAERRADRETVDTETGELIVLLKKKDGIWYWNPFGW